VNHFVVSQVNPHARLLAPMQKGPRLAVNRGPASSLVNDALTSTESITKVVVDFCRDQVRSSVKVRARGAAKHSALADALASTLRRRS
jgi:hypothetical protein